MVKLRLQRKGRKKAPFYHIVAAHIESPRDGKFIERLGTYNPTTVPAQITLDVNKAIDWLQKGAQPTTTVNAILRYKGVLYKKHLLRGVKKGAFSMEEAENRFEEWVKSHQDAVMDHVKKIEDKKAKIKEAEVERINAKRDEKAEKAATKARKEAAEKEAEQKEIAVHNEAAVEESANANVADANDATNTNERVENTETTKEETINE